MRHPGVFNHVCQTVPSDTLALKCQLQTCTGQCNSAIVCMHRESFHFMIEKKNADNTDVFCVLLMCNRARIIMHYVTYDR